MATTVTYKGATLTTVDNQTKTLQTAGTWMEDDLTLTDVSSGGGSSIGVATPKANLLSMIYALEHGTGKTGTFVLSQTIPNTKEQIFDAGSSSVTNFAILQEDIGNVIDTGIRVVAKMFVWLYDESTAKRVFFKLSDRIQDGSNTFVSATKPDLDLATSYYEYAHWWFENGVLSVQGQYNRNASYTPLRAGVTYRWVAW